MSSVVISDLATANARCESLLYADSIGLDCEGVELGRVGGEVTLVQVVDQALRVYLFDVFTCPAILSGNLKTVLENPSIVKIIHDCRGDRVNLQKQFGVRLQPVFDTQIAHKFIMRERMRIGFNKLCQKYQLTQNSIKESIRYKYRANNNLWKTRPLTQELIQYASGDVINLIQLHKNMERKIRGSDRSDFQRMCSDATIFPGQVDYSHF